MDSAYSKNISLMERILKVMNALKEKEDVRSIEEIFRFSAYLDKTLRKLKDSSMQEEKKPENQFLK